MAERVLLTNKTTPPNKFQFSFNTADVWVAAALLVIGFTVYVALEIATHSMFYALWVTGAFAAFFAVPALFLLWHAPLRVKLTFISTFLLLILVVRNLDWNTRKPFIRALDTIQTGMTTEQVDAVMQNYIRSPKTGVSAEDTVGYRHTNESWGNADIVLVTFKDGQVIRIEYLPD